MIITCGGGGLAAPGELLSRQPTGAKSVGYETAMVTFRLQQGKQLTASTLGVSLKVCLDQRPRCGSVVSATGIAGILGTFGGDADYCTSRNVTSLHNELPLVVIKPIA